MALPSFLDIRSDERVVVVGPHMDDLPACAAHVLLRATRPIAITVCAGWRPGPLGWWDERCGFASSEEASRLRRAEDAAALANTDAEVVHLDFVDGQYEREPGDAERLEQELRRRFEGAHRVFVPAGIGGHVDHLLVRDVAIRARRPGQVLAVYGDYGYNTTQDWEESSRLSRYGVLPSDYVSLALPEAWVRRKQAMLACYPSQAASFSAVPSFLEPHLLAVEWYAELPENPAPVEPWARPYREDGPS